MKTVLFLSAIACASAFAPASQSARSTQLAAADLDSLRGVGPETGGKVVSRLWLGSGYWAVTAVVR
jgi:hypothetical protein